MTVLALDEIRELAAELRVDSIRCSTAGGSGHPTSSMSAADLDAFNDAGHPVRVSHLAVRDLPGSGTPAELMAAAGISTGQIAQAARDLLD